MQIIGSTETDYAHVRWDESREDRLRALEQEVMRSDENSGALEGLLIEISAVDSVPDETKRSLQDGRFYLIGKDK